MATEATTEAFKSEVKFTFQGVKRQVPIITQKLQFGRYAGTVILTPDLDKLSFEDMGEVWNSEDLQLEMLVPALKKHISEVNSEANKAATSSDGTFDEAKRNQVYCDLLSKLTTAIEGLRSMKKKLAGLMQQFNSMDIDTANPEWLQLVNDIKSVNKSIQDHNKEPDVEKHDAVAA